MKTVIVNWTTQDQVVPNAESADHFIVGLGTTEHKVPLASVSDRFDGIEPGTYSIWITCVDVNDKELAPPLYGSVTVPTDASAPIPITVTASVQ